MANRLTIAQRRWRLSLHPFFVAIWLGATVALLWLTIAAPTGPGFDTRTVEASCSTYSTGRGASRPSVRR